MFHELLSFRESPRRIRFPFPLQQFSYSLGVNAGKTIRLRGIELEFCLRIASDEMRAEDEFEHERIVSPFPYLLIKPPYVEHANHIRGIRSALSLSYAPEQLEDFIRAGIIPSATARGWPVQLTAEIEQLIQRVRELTSDTRSPGALEKLDLSAFQLLELLSLQRRNETVPVEWHEEQIRQIAAYFHIHYVKRIDMNELLKRHSFSRRSFFRWWAKFYEPTPAEYLRDIRLNQAARLLRETDWSTDTILQQTGFSDRTFFFHSFRQKNGQNPADYRRRFLKHHNLNNPVSGSCPDDNSPV